MWQAFVEDALRCKDSADPATSFQMEAMLVPPLPFSASPGPLNSVGEAGFTSNLRQHDLAPAMYNTALGPTTVGHMSFQGLLRSVSTRSAEDHSMMEFRSTSKTMQVEVHHSGLLNGVMCSSESGGTSSVPAGAEHANNGYGGSSSILPSAIDANADNTPFHFDVDETGYASSDSSKYDASSEGGDELQATNIDGDEDMAVPLSTAGDGGCNEENAVADCPCLQGKPFYHVMVDVQQLEAHPWKKRNRTPKGVVLPDCRVPKGMGPIEIALRNAPHRQSRYIFEPLLGLTFDSEDEGYDFYNMYSWEVGFGIKRDSISTNRKTSYQTMREFRCLCSGAPDLCDFNSKKSGCKAMMRLLRTEDGGWYISHHNAEHNHHLTDSCGETKEWFSHKKLDPFAKDMIQYLRENNVSLTKVHCILGSVYGSMHNIPFTKKSMRTICSQIAKDQMADDVQKTMNVFREIRSSDPGFQFSVDLDEDKKIKTLLWINGRSRDQYMCFGDVITFDTTYCTNIYKMPFGLFVGVNNHFQTTIFGGVFMKDETISSFQWVFAEFASLMGGKIPETVFTDQCAAMAAALAHVWKDATHLLCKWHMFKDAPAKLGVLYTKGAAFRKLFHKIINDMLTIDEFERAWAYMLERFGLEGNEYLAGLYGKREKWAKPYFRECFCARMSSTQRSESANHMLKRFVPRNCSMNRFVVQFNKMLFDRKDKEDQAEFGTKIVKDVRKRAWPIEEHAKTFYTNAVYALFRKEVDKATRYFAVERVKGKEYQVKHVKPNMRLPWDREHLTVVVVNNGERYECECGLYQHFGVLCGHVLRVLVQIGVYEIPKAHICKRWTRAARDELPVVLKEYEKGNLCMESMTYRHSFLYTNAVEVVHEGNKDLGAFNIVAKSLKKIQRKLKEYYLAKEKTKANVDANVVVVQNNYYTTESEGGIDSGSDLDAVLSNTFGASGSSAGMSDSELLGIRAPSVNRAAGRPRQTRFKGALDYFEKRKKSKGSTGLKQRRRLNDVSNSDGTTKKKVRCGDCGILGHSATQCRKKAVEISSEIPEF